ncbi:hypothetical protein FM119_00525 [Mycetocola reblochoni REB411]|uniref:Uncharacterized protein n=1 Tax=Mycetocola reblochoni REB411 TaxID=1255698 RepID=A0A1R4I9D3_9MICO|nr:hypothetical protein FM119_00525 [Mycetocola reblochoni REB411]
MAVIGAVVTIGYAALGLAQILVLNPLAAVPGMELDQIRAVMATRGERIDAWPPVTFAVVGAGLAVVIVVATLAGRPRPTTVLLFVSLGLVGGAPAYWIASFGAGMSLADAFAIGGGDVSPWAVPLYAVSAVALVTALVLPVARAARGRAQILRTSTDRTV